MTRAGRVTAWTAGCGVLAITLVVAIALSPGADRGSPGRRDPQDPPAGRGAPRPIHLGAQFHGLWDDWDDDRRDLVLDMLAAHGVERLRIDISWAMVQPEGPGRYDHRWGVPKVDGLLEEVSSRDFDVLAMFWLTPDWANGRGGERAMPVDPEDYATAIGWAAERWKDEVSAWEIWNEPNSDEFLMPPSPEGYAELLRAAYPAVKGADPEAEVVFGGTQYVDTEWIHDAYRAGVSGSFDVMGVHPYQGLASESPDQPDDGSPYRLAHTAALRDVMRAHGDAEVPVWFTEIGWSAHPNTPQTAPYELGVTERQQADYLLRALDYVERRLPDVERVYWYTSFDTSTGDVHQDSFGLIRSDGTARPVLRAAECYLASECTG